MTRPGSPRKPPASARWTRDRGSSRSEGPAICSTVRLSSAPPVAGSPPTTAANPRVKSASIRCRGSSGSAAAAIAVAQPITPATSLSRKRARASSARASVRSAPPSRSTADASSSTAAGTEPAYSSSIPRVNCARPSARSSPGAFSTRAASDRVRPVSPAAKASAAAVASQSAIRTGSSPSPAARSIAIDAAAYPWRLRVWLAVRTRSSASDWSGPTTASARCQVPAIESGSAASTAASVRWADRCSAAVARLSAAVRSRGWRNASSPPERTRIPRSVASSSAAATSIFSRVRAAATVAELPDRSSAVSSTARRAGADSSLRCSPYSCRRRSPTAGASGSGAAPIRCASESRCAISSMASGLPPVSSTRRSATRSATRSRSRARASVGVRRESASDRQALDELRRDLARSPGPDEADGVVAESAGGERQRRGRFAVDPLQIVDQHEHRDSSGLGGEQRQHGRGDQEAVGRGPRGFPAERDGQGGSLGARDLGEHGAQRTECLQQSRVREHRLGLDSARPQAAEADGPTSGRQQQRGLPHPRLALEHHRRRRSSAGGLEQGIQPAELGSAAHQLARPIGRTARPNGGFSPRERPVPAAKVEGRHIICGRSR